MTHTSITSKILKTLIAFFVLSYFPLNGQVLDYSTKVKIEKGEKITIKSFVIQVNDKESSWLSEIEIAHQESEEFKLLEAKIFDRNGEEVRKLKNKEVSTRSDISYSTFFQDRYIESFSLHWNQYPYQIKYSYSITEEEFVSLVNWVPVLAPDLETLNAQLHVEVPSSYRVKVDYSDDFNYTTYFEDDFNVMHWTITDVKASERELLAPSLRELLPSVTVIPQKFIYGIEGASDSWASYGNWYHRLNGGSDGLTIHERNKVDELLHGVTNETEKIRILYHYLQDNVRYINVALDIGGLKSYPASYVCKNKYGDCKALTTYMKALLGYAGIKSHYALIQSGTNSPKIKEHLPGPQFNHVILCVPQPGDTIWLENTSNVLPFNYLGSSTHDRFSLLVKEEGSQLVKTPVMELSDVLRVRQFTYDLKEDGTGDLRINQILKGKDFERCLYREKNLDKQEHLEKLIKPYDINKKDVQTWNIMHENRDEFEAEAEIQTRCSNMFREIGKLKVLKLPPFELPSFEKPEKRSYPVRISLPINNSDSVSINMAFLDDYDIQLPEDTIIQSSIGRYESFYEKKTGKIRVSRVFQLFKGDYAIGDFDELYKFIESIENVRKQSAIVLRKSVQ